jgi:hypothetical protein
MSDQRPDPPTISLREHPRAAGGIRRLKAWGGLIAFAVTGYASHASGMSFAAAGTRALAAGVVGYLLAWALAIAFWRALVRAETKTAIERIRARRAELLAARRSGGDGA